MRHGLTGCALLPLSSTTSQLTGAASMTGAVYRVRKGRSGDYHDEALLIPTLTQWMTHAIPGHQPAAPAYTGWEFAAPGCRVRDEFRGVIQWPPEDRQPDITVLQGKRREKCRGRQADPVMTEIFSLAARGNPTRFCQRDLPLLMEMNSCFRFPVCEVCPSVCVC